MGFLLHATTAWAAEEEHVASSAGGTNWTTPGNTQTNNSAYATYDNTAQDWLTLTNFGFTFTAESIDSIEVVIDGDGVGGSASRREMDAQLIVGGSGSGDIVTYELPAAEGLIRVNGSTDAVWNTAIDTTQAKAVNFGVQLRDNNTTAHQLDIDSVSIIITYTPVAGASKSQVIRTTIID